MAELVRTVRLSLGANAQRTASVVVPSGGFSRLEIKVDLSSADQLDPAKRIRISVESSQDGVSGWTFLGGAETWGSNTPQRQALIDLLEQGLPSIRMPCPPVGWTIRGTIQAGPVPVTVGLIITVI